MSIGCSFVDCCPSGLDIIHRNVKESSVDGNIEVNFLFEIFCSTIVLFVGSLVDYPCFGLLGTSALGFKVRVDPLLGCSIACVQQILQIYL